MTEDRDPQLHFTENTYDVDEAEFRLSALRARVPRDGRHYWGIGFFFRVDDPGADTTSAYFDHENLAVIGNPYCLWCQTDYGSPLVPLMGTCPGNTPEKEPCGG